MKNNTDLEMEEVLECYMTSKSLEIKVYHSDIYPEWFYKVKYRDDISQRHPQLYLQLRWSLVRKL